jgi:hypothetical protein
VSSRSYRVARLASDYIGSGMYGVESRGGLFIQGIMSATAAPLAYFPAKAPGSREGFWAAVTAVAVVQPPRRMI